MSIKAHFTKSQLISMSLAKVGNPLRDEPLQTSKKLCHFQADDAELLTHCFLKPFRALERFRFWHHNDLESNEVFTYVREIFSDNKALLKNSRLIAKSLYEKSRHPNINSGDLCVGLIQGVEVAGQEVQAVSLIKSESKVPFLQISVEDGDLRLTTQQGIYPEKIDKGCLILNHSEADGYLVYTFDKSGGSTHFWLRDFLGVEQVSDSDYQTRRYSEMCLEFAKKGLPEDMRQEDRLEVADRAMGYIAETAEFNFDDFRNIAFPEPELSEQFDDFKAGYEEELGSPLESSFTVTKAIAEKARNKLKGTLKLDTGVDLRFSRAFVDHADQFFERGFDDDKHMNFVKIYFHKEK